MAAYKTIRDYLRAITPAWLSRPKGAAWLRAMGDEKDTTVARAKDAVKQRFFELADRDAQALGGQERQIVRGPLETNATYGERLVGAWDAWSWAGTAKGLLEAMKGAGLPLAVIETYGGLQYWLEDSVFQLSATVNLFVRAGRTLPIEGHVVVLVADGGNDYFLLVDGVQVGGGGSYMPSVNVDLGDQDDRLAGVTVAWSDGRAGDYDMWVFWVGPAAEGVAISKLPAGSWWNYGDSNNTFWSKFTVLFPGYWQGFDVDQVALTQLLIRRWKSAQSTCSVVGVIKAGRCIGFPQRRWGDGIAWGGNDTGGFLP
jgi:hypothetical protein